MRKDYRYVFDQPEWDALCPDWKRIPAPAPKERIEIIRDHRSGHYAPGEKMVFSLRFLSDGKPVAGKKFHCTLERDFQETKKWEQESLSGQVRVETSLDRPGFVRLEVTCDGLSAASGAGVETEKIAPSREVPDFDEFWKKQLRRLAEVPPEVISCEEVPLDDPAYETQVRCYDVQIRCAGNAPVSGYLAVPRQAAAHSLPAYVFFHGAGVRPAFQPLTWAAHGFLAFNVNAHGLPNRESAEFYRHQNEEVLFQYSGRLYEKAEDSLFCDMTLRVVRALEYLKSRPEWNGKFLAVHGGSQGGFQTLAAAGLDSSVTLAVVNAPAMCNLSAALDGRSPSWPRTVLPGGDPEKMKNACYFDGVAFARRACPQCKGLFSVGFSDPAARPSSVYAAYHAFGGQEKEIVDFPDLGHELSVFWLAEEPIFELAGI